MGDQQQVCFTNFFGRKRISIIFLLFPIILKALAKQLSPIKKFGTCVFLERQPSHSPVFVFCLFRDNQLQGAPSNNSLVINILHEKLQNDTSKGKRKKNNNQ